MKAIYLLFGLLFPLISYSQTQTVQRENGWYYIIDGQPDSISQEPIATVKDFINLTLEADAFGKIFIIGTITDTKKWADATEKSIGKRIGFIYNNQLITSPQVNMRIEGGNFMISNPGNYNLKEMYQQLLKEKAASTNKDQ